jgi:anaerobic selenocysteine-containing dehydrogenase
MSQSRPPGVSRRRFIHASGLAGSAALVAACSRTPPSARRLTVRGACHHDCPDTCAWVVTTEDGRAVALEGDARHPYTRGTLCEKMDGFLADVVYSPDRVLHPMKRVGPKGQGRFERVSWDEALDDVAKRLRAVVEQHGAEAVLPYSFAGTMGMVQGWSLDGRFFARLGASRLERTICGSTASAGLRVTLGTGTGMMPEDVLDSRLIVLWGGNPVVSNPHGWALVEQARARGARVVSIDPLRSPTAAKADWHVRPRPGTDTALALGLMHVLVREKRHDAGYVERHTLGFAPLEKRLAEYPPERVEQITGVGREDVVRLARDYARIRPAAIQVHIGLEKHRQGGMTYRTIACLPALVGAWREPGGGLLHSTSDLFDAAMNLAALSAVPDAKPARSINMVQLGRALTDPGLRPAVHAIVVYDSNPATIAPDQNRVRRGLEREDLLTVVLDHFVTDTARYADYVLPATTQAEHLDLLVPYGTRYVSLNQPAIEPRGEAIPNTEFFRRLARRMGFDEPYLQASDEDLVRLALDSRHPHLKGITYERLRREGWAALDLPPRRLPFAAGGFPTPSGKCELYSEALKAQGMDPLPGWVDEGRPPADASLYPLHFMSPKWSRHFVNSSHANQPRLEKAAGPPLVRLHPEDAGRRGIASGDRVRVFNERGEVTLTALVTDEMQPGVVTLWHGWWASRIGGASANALTSDALADLGGGSRLHDVWVDVARAARPATA